MKATYRVLAYLIPVIVALQASFIALGVFGLGKFVEDGNDFTKSVLENGGSTGDVGFMLHSFGANAAALVALLLLIVSFFAKIEGGVRAATVRVPRRRAAVGAGVRVVRRLGGRRPARAQRVPAVRARPDGGGRGDQVHQGRLGAVDGGRLGRLSAASAHHPHHARDEGPRHVSRDRVRLLLACLATLAILLPIGYLWQRSRVPSTYSVMDMGYLDYGGGRRAAGHTDRAAAARSVADLTVGTDRPADKVVDLDGPQGRR